MSTGGATWAAAAVLTIGGSNTFDISTTVAGTEQPFWAGYWTYTATGPVTLHLDASATEGVSPDTYLKVFTGTTPPGTSIAEDDDSGTGFTSMLDVVVEAGQTVHIRAGTYDNSGDGVTILHLAATTTVYVAPLVNDYPITIDFYGPRLPIAWDGGHKHLMASVTNNNRWYGIETTEDLAPSYLGGFGYNPTPSTSSNPFTENSDFVHPGIVPMVGYVDAEATNKFQVMTVDVAASHGAPGAVQLSRRAFPSQTGSSSGFIRSLAVFPDDPVVRAYGTNSVTHVVECWETTIAEDGTLSAWTSLGTVTYPDPGALPGGGAHYGATVHSPMVFSDRLAIDPATKMIYDRLTPLVFRDGYPLIASESGYPIGDAYAASVRVAPGHLVAIQRTSDSSQYWVTDNEFNADATGVTQQGVWEAPAGLRVYAGYTYQGKVVAYAYDFAGVLPTRAFYDIFGDIIEFTNPAITLTQTTPNGLYIRPTLPQAGTPDVTNAYDSWVSISTTPMVLEMYGQGPPPSDPMYPCDQRIIEPLSMAHFLGAPNGQYGDGVIYATEEILRRIVTTVSTTEGLIGPGSSDGRTTYADPSDGPPSLLEDDTDDTYWELWMTQDAPRHVLTWSGLTLEFATAFDPTDYRSNLLTGHLRFLLDDDGAAGTSAVWIRMNPTDFSDDTLIQWRLNLSAAQRGVAQTFDIRNDAADHPEWELTASDATGADSTDPWSDILRLAAAGNLTVSIFQSPVTTAPTVDRMFANGSLRVFEFYFPEVLG